MRLNEYEYGYLKGDTEMWPGWGAALAVVYEFCNNQNLGQFGKPTERGQKLMEEYEQCEDIV